MIKKLSFSYIKHKSSANLSSINIKLLEKAYTSLSQSYAPYSKFHVGCAILLSDNIIINASNQENAAYPSGLCAERVAVFYAKSQYPNKDILTIAVVAKSKEFEITEILTPCGACRQVLSEYEKNQSKSINLLLSTGKEVYEFPSVQSILPFSFHPQNLKK